MNHELLYCSKCGCSNLLTINDKFCCPACKSNFSKDFFSSVYFKEINNAFMYRQILNFEKSITLYKNIIANFPNENLDLAYWGLCLCNDKIVFEIDKNNQSMPICYNNSNNICENNACYDKLMNYLKETNQDSSIYDELKKTINNSININSNIERKKDYQICIALDCQKNNTKYQVANNLGLEVFKQFSSLYSIFYYEKNVSKLNVNNFEELAKFYNSLVNSEVLVLICTSKDNLQNNSNNNILKNFKIKNPLNKQKIIMPILIDGFDIATLPNELNNTLTLSQSTKMMLSLSKQLASILNPIDRFELKHIENLLRKKEYEEIYENQKKLLINQIEIQRQNQNIVVSNEILQSLINKGFLQFKERNYFEASRVFDKLISMFPNIVNLYKLKICSLLEIEDESELSGVMKDITFMPEFKKALECSDEIYKKELNNYALMTKYNVAKKFYKDKEYGKAYNKFLELRNYKDSNEILLLCKGILDEQFLKAQNFEKDFQFLDALAIYENLNNYKNSYARSIYCLEADDCEKNYEKAINKYNETKYFEAICFLNKITLTNFRDTENLKIEYNDLIKKCYEQGVYFQQQNDFEQSNKCFLKILNYKDTATRSELCEKLIKSKNSYENALKLFKENKFEEAFKIFNTLPIKNYKETDKYITICNENIFYNLGAENYKKGDYITAFEYLSKDMLYDFKDSKSLRQICQLQFEDIYKDVNAKIKAFEYFEALEILIQFVKVDYKDSQELMDFCVKNLFKKALSDSAKGNYETAFRLQDYNVLKDKLQIDYIENLQNKIYMEATVYFKKEHYKKAYPLFKLLGKYKDSEELSKRTLEGKKDSKKFYIGVAIAVISIVLSLIFSLNNIIIPNIMFYKANNYLVNGQYSKAIEVYNKINFSKSERMISAIKITNNLDINNINYTIENLLANSVNVTIKYNVGNEEKRRTYSDKKQIDENSPLLLQVEDTIYKDWDLTKSYYVFQESNPEFIIEVNSIN